MPTDLSTSSGAAVQSDGCNTTPPPLSESPSFSVLVDTSFIEPLRSVGPPSPPIDLLPPLPPLPKIPPSSLNLESGASKRAEVELLKLASRAGCLQEVHQILSQYILTQTPDDATGKLQLGMFGESIVEAILHQHPLVLSYLFFMRVGEPKFFIKVAVDAPSCDIFQVFLEYGWDINAPLERTLPPALGFVSHDIVLIKWFLDHGADPNAMCGWDLTPMSEAMYCGSLATIEYLFSCGGNIERGQLLHNAVQRDKSDAVEIVRMLLDKGIPINEIQYQNHGPSWKDRLFFGLGTPLHYAAQDGRVELVSFLLSRGADPTILDTKGRTVLQSAEYYRQSNVVEFLRGRLT